LLNYCSALAAFLTGLSKGGLGDSMGALITPMLALVMPLDQAIGLTMPIFIIGDIFAWPLTGAGGKPLIQVLLLGGILGVILGTFVITKRFNYCTPPGLGAIALLFVLHRVFRTAHPEAAAIPAASLHGVVAGSVAGSPLLWRMPAAQPSAYTC